MSTLVLHVSYEHVCGAIRGSKTECAVARALRAWLPIGVWSFDGEWARNDHYGAYCLLERVGYDGGAAAVAEWDEGGPLRHRIYVLIPAPHPAIAR